MAWLASLASLANVGFLAFRRSADPAPPEDHYSWVFIDQHDGDALSVWLGLLHVQVYRDGRRPYVGWEGRPPRALQWVRGRLLR